MATLHHQVWIGAPVLGRSASAWPRHVP